MVSIRTWKKKLPTISAKYDQMKLVWLSAIFAVAFWVTRLYTGWEWNYQAINFIKGESITISAFDCNHFWLAGADAFKRGDLSMQRHIFEKGLGCSSNHLIQVQNFFPQDKDMALLAIKLYPNNPNAWFWLGETQASDAPEQAIKSYWKGLHWDPHNSRIWIQIGQAFVAMDPEIALITYANLDIDQLDSNDSYIQLELQFILATIISKSNPNRAIQLFRQGLHVKSFDGLRWAQLGYLLSKTEPQAAFDAFLQSCELGDPGLHGCYGAGRMMEQLGDTKKAIEYYRRSFLEKARERADELEAQLDEKD